MAVVVWRLVRAGGCDSRVVRFCDAGCCRGSPHRGLWGVAWVSILTTGLASPRVSDTRESQVEATMSFVTSLPKTTAASYWLHRLALFDVGGVNMRVWLPGSTGSLGVVLKASYHECLFAFINNGKDLEENISVSCISMEQQMEFGSPIPALTRPTLLEKRCTSSL